MFKQSKPRGLSGVPSGAGPEQMVAALQLLGQARALGNPTDKELRDMYLSRPAFVSTLNRMKKKDRLSDARSNYWANVAGGAGIGGLSGYALGDSEKPIGRAAGTLLAALLGAGAGHVRSNMLDNRVMKTMKILKERGVLTPELLRRAYPVLI